MIKTNIKMRVTPEQSRKVQEICFENGIEWQDSKKTLHEYECIIIKKDFLLTCNSISFFNEYSKELQEINADLFIKTNGTCEESSFNELYEKVIERVNEHQLQEETYLTKYTSQPKDLESALKKIENLHIALNKKVEKNKNQALEITKLLDQKKDLQNKIDIVNNNSIEIIDTFSNNIAEYEKEIKYLKDKVKEKDTIISYLRSELK